MAHGHPLTFAKDSDLKIGICPVCNKRLTAECEHRTMETETWLAAHIAAEQMKANERRQYPADPRTVAERQADADWADLKATQEDARL